MIKYYYTNVEEICCLVLGIQVLYSVFENFCGAGQAFTECNGRWESRLGRLIQRNPEC